MIHWMMPYTVAFWLCGVLWALATAMYFSRRELLVRFVAFPRELGLVLGLFGLWQVAGTLSVMKVDGALKRGTWLYDTERTLFLPSEHWFQGLFLPHPSVVRFFNLYYASMHFTCMIIFLIWLFLRHREHYPRIRTVLALSTAGALLIQLIPVAPPRMIPKAHLVDTALAYGQSVYGPMNANAPDQLSAMPSVHVIWAVLVGYSVWRVADSKWRWIGPAHTVMTITVVTATANHYWADGIVGVALLLLAAGIRWTARRGYQLVRPVSVALPGVGTSATSDTPGAPEAPEAPDPELARSP